MTITEERKDFLGAKSTPELIHLGILLKDQIDDLNDDYKWIQWLLTKEMISTNATQLSHPEVECKARIASTEYDYGILAMARELLDPEDIKKWYTPEHEEVVVVKESYDGRIGVGLKKYGGDIRKFIEEGTIKGKITGITLKHKE